MAGRTRPRKRRRTATPAVKDERMSALGVRLPNWASPTLDQLAFYGGVGLLGFAGLLDPVVAGVVILGHVLVSQHRSRLAQELGEALEEV